MIRFEICAPVSLALVCFRLKSSNEANERLEDILCLSGRLKLVHTCLRDKYVLRMAIGSPHTRDCHIRAAWEFIQGQVDAAEADVAGVQ